MTDNLPVIRPLWSAPENVVGLTTTRQSGVSMPPYNSFNLATHVGDSFEAVTENRKLLQQVLNLASEPAWLQQDHTTDIVKITGLEKTVPLADAAWTDQYDLPLVVLTADCLPILITNKNGSMVAAIHAGWKGLANGIVSNSIQALPENPENLTAWIGPAISQHHFEVGDDVYLRFQEKPFVTADFFQAGGQGKWFADLPGLAKRELIELGVAEVSLSGNCSYGEEKLFYSYRRDGRTGRMASLIWLNKV